MKSAARNLLGFKGVTGGTPVDCISFCEKLKIFGINILYIYIHMGL